MKQRRYSKQRELIHQCLKERTDHPSAEMLYQTLKPLEPSLSLGTVYRNLNQLVADGHALRMSFDADRYDADTTEHPHFFCTHCHRLYDLDLPLGNSLDQMVADLGYAVERYNLVFRGTCLSCRRQDRQEQQNTIS